MIASPSRRARISEETIAQVKERADIYEIVSEHVILKKSGRDFSGLCPFHDEKTPSFSVSPSKQMYYCFGCGQGGDALKFIQQIGNQSFADAVLGLADRHGIEVQTEDPQQQQEFDRQRSYRQQLHEVLAVAAQFFAAALASPKGRVAREYLVHDRGLSDATIGKYQLGYAPASWDALLRHLKRRGFDDDIIDAAGLSSSNENRRYDRFRDRVIIPIRDELGRTIGFGGRALGDAKPKYLNSPETELFDKSRTLFGLDIAKVAIAYDVRAIVVEWYFDAIALHEAGIASAVAVLGTALTEPHLKKLLRYTDGKRLVLNFDADRAGEKAADRAVGTVESLAYQGSIELRVLALPIGKDADSFLKASGVEAYRAALDAAPMWVEWRIDGLGRSSDLSDSGNYQRAWKQMLEVVSPVRDKVLRARYAERCAQWLACGKSKKIPALSFAISRELMTGRVVEAVPSDRVVATDAPRVTSERSLLMLFLHCSDLRPSIRQSISYLERLQLSKESPLAASGLDGIWQALRDSEDPLAALIEMPEMPDCIGNPLALDMVTQHQVERGSEVLSSLVAAIEQRLRESRLDGLGQQLCKTNIECVEEIRCLRREIAAERAAIAKLRSRRRVKSAIY